MTKKDRYEGSAPGRDPHIVHHALPISLAAAVGAMALAGAVLMS